jgi:hypothetical protein
VSTCSVIWCGTGQRGCQSSHRWRCNLTGATWFHLPFGRHEREHRDLHFRSPGPLSSPSSSFISIHFFIIFICPRGCDAVFTCRRFLERTFYYIRMICGYFLFVSGSRADASRFVDLLNVPTATIRIKRSVMRHILNLFCIPLWASFG